MTANRSLLRYGAPLALALLAAPAPAQQNTRGVESRRTWTHTTNNDGHRLELRSTGDVELNEAGDWVARLAPGARLTVEEDGRGPGRRAEFRPGADGRVRVVYAVEGRERTLDADGEAWLRRTLSGAVRESGFDAERRVAHIRARGGVQGVLNEIGRLGGDAGKRLYYNALFAGAPLRDDEFARAVRAVARIDSDTEKRLVLGGAIPAARTGPRLAALLATTGTIESDTEARLVLARVGERHALEDAASRQAFFAAVDGIESDTERRLVLSSLLTRGTPSRPVLVDALRSAGRMRSDVEKRLVLMGVSPARLEDGEVTRAFQETARGIRSDSERSLVLRHLARSGR